MHQLRRSIIALATLFFIFFNIQRIHIDGDVHPIDLQNFVYALGFFAALVIIGVPAVRRLPVVFSLAGAVVVYLICKLLIFVQPTRPFLGDVHTYITITEIVFVALVVLFAHNLANNLAEFESAVEECTLANINSPIRKLEDAIADVQVELNRSRRYQHPLTVIVVEPQAQSLAVNLHRLLQQVQSAISHRIIVASIARAIAKVLRSTDMMLEQDQRGRVIIVCPETTADASRELAQRIQTSTLSKLGLAVQFEIHDFPDGVLTFDELMHHVETPQLTNLTVMPLTESGLQPTASASASAFREPSV